MATLDPIKQRTVVLLMRPHQQFARHCSARTRRFVIKPSLESGLHISTAAKLVGFLWIAQSGQSEESD
jgi:hypothetical protein